MFGGAVALYKYYVLGEEPNTGILEMSQEAGKIY